MVKRALLAMCLAVLPYWSALDAPFVFDDLPAIEVNLNVRNGVCPPFGASRSLGYCAMGLAVRWFGYAPRSFHLVSVAIHAVNSALVFFIALSFLSKNSALFAACLFAVHPIQSEAVIYAAQMPELVWSFFGLSAVLVILWVRGSAGMAMAMALAACAFEAKESAVILPALFVILRPSWKNAIWMTLATLAGGLLAFPQLNGAVGSQWTGHMTVWNYAVTSLGTLARYLQLILAPVNQNLDPQAGPSGILAFVSLVILLLLALFAWKRRGTFSTCMAWFFLTILPTTSILVLLDPMAEHRLYFAMAGASIAFASFWKEESCLSS